MSFAMTAKKTPTEIVIVLHGLANSRLNMWRQSRVLKQAGYAVADWTYNTLKGGMLEQMERLEQRLPEVSGYSKVHGVGHSLGGLMLRGIFARHAATLPLGRLVMQGSPNQGAGIVNRHRWLFGQGPLNRQIVQDLAEGSEAIATLGIPPMEIGVIAGVHRFNLINPFTWLNTLKLGDEPHDGTVEAKNTRVPGMTDYLELPVNHVRLPFHRDVVQASLRFLQTGKFRP